MNKNKKLKITSFVISLIVMLFIQSFIEDFSFKVYTNEKIEISQLEPSSQYSNNFKINSIYQGDKLLDLNKVDIKGWTKANTKTGYPIQTNGYSKDNKLSIKPSPRLMFNKLTVNFETSPKYSTAVMTYLKDHTMTMYASSSDNRSYVDINYTDFLSILTQTLIFIGSIVLFSFFIYNLIRRIEKAENKKKEILYIGKDYILNFLVFGVSVYGLSKLRDHVNNEVYFTFFHAPFTYNDLVEFISIVFLASLGMKSIYKRKQNIKALDMTNWILFILNPFMSFYILESAYNPNFASMEIIYILINALILFLIQILIYIVIRKKRLSMIFILVLSIAFGIANDALYILRDSPLIPAFLGSLGVAADVAKDTVIQLNGHSLMAFSLASLWLLVVSSINEGKITISKKSYAKQLVGYCAMFGLITVVSVNYFIKQNGVGVNLWRPSRTYYVEGSPYSFYRILANQIITAPKGYNEKEVEDTLEEYYNKDIGTKGNKKPNIVIIQSEALADYYGKGNLKLSENPIAFQRSLDENAIQGKAYVSVLGGGTVNSEYETLTSVPLTFFPLGAYPFQQYVKEGHTSVARVLENQGYQTFITHPNKPTNYSRQEAWPNLGFKNMAFLGDYDNSPESFEPTNGFLKESVAFDKIKEQFEKKPADKPLFAYLVTMQNHGGYTSNVPGKIKVLNETNGDDQGASHYVNLLKKSDEDLKRLVEYFKAYKEPTILCIFGDHQPQNYDVFMKLIKSGGDYTNKDVFYTPLTIWANYDIDEEKDLDISVNELTPYLLEKAGGIKLSAYQKYMLDIHKDYPIISTKQIYNNKGEEVSKDEEFQKRNNKLNSIIYYEMKQDTKSNKYFNEASK
ncbi:arylsulfatase [Anaerococcus sp. HMSC075B03]|uniref:LTA synthase family protein n=1 Tax=Anaerococcus sp. HMSC075B03 TaxID=1739537 RepID=UPI0008A1347A|nr:LTA synthase family protein [Anaerococcus sp. HMSC075B03]OFO41978.1 arylsulfatase [Anaerococcus sp. HMSC075B03]